MTMEEALYSYLSGYAGLTALVGTRIYPEMLPDSPTYPAVSYSRVSTRRERTLTIPSVAAVEARFQCSCWGERYADAKAVAVQIKAALQDFQGVMGGTGGVTVLEASTVNELDQHDARVRVYHVPVDVTILYLP